MGGCEIRNRNSNDNDMTKRGIPSANKLVGNIRQSEKNKLKATLDFPFFALGPIEME